MLVELDWPWLDLRRTLLRQAERMGHRPQGVDPHGHPVSARTKRAAWQMYEQVRAERQWQVSRPPVLASAVTRRVFGLDE
jgi:hypothetical protein